MIDTHSHIYEPEFNADREDVVQRARQAGVERILLPNINADSIAPMLELCHRHPGYCYPMLGLHPEDVKPDTYLQVLADMKARLADPEHPYIAIGEVGLDFYWDKSHAREQEEAFRRQIEWSIEHRLPLDLQEEHPAGSPDQRAPGADCTRNRCALPRPDALSRQAKRERLHRRSASQNSIYI